MDGGAKMELGLLVVITEEPLNDTNFAFPQDPFGSLQWDFALRLVTKTKTNSTLSMVSKLLLSHTSTSTRKSYLDTITRYLKERNKISALSGSFDVHYPSTTNNQSPISIREALPKIWNICLKNKKHFKRLHHKN